MFTQVDDPTLGPKHGKGGWFVAKIVEIVEANLAK